MEISAIPPKVRTADLPFEKVASSAALNDREKLGEAARQFEAMLLRQILADAHKPMFKSPFLPQGSTHAIYQDMVTAEMADSISKGGSFGFAKMLQMELSPPTPNKIEDSTEAARSI